jgi:hypothetical protein
MQDPQSDVEFKEKNPHLNQYSSTPFLKYMPFPKHRRKEPCPVFATHRAGPAFYGSMRANSSPEFLLTPGLHNLFTGRHNLRSPQGNDVRGNGKTIFGR